MPTSEKSRDTSRIEALVRSAHRRFIGFLFLEQLAVLVSLLFAGLSLLLVLGTDIFSSYWVVVFAAGGLLVAVAEMRNKRITHYRVAQLLDKHLSAKDTLSTAWFLRVNGMDRTGLAQQQLQKAESVASSASPASAFHFHAGPLWGLAATVAVIAFGLFGARYFVTQTLSFHQSLVPLRFAAVFERTDQARNPGQQGQRDRANNPQSAHLPGPGVPQDTNGKSAPNRAEGGSSGDANANPAEKAKTASDAPNQQSGDKRGSAQSKDGSSGTPGGTSSDRQNGDEQAQNAKDETGRADSSSLVDRMKDALSSLAAKMQGKSTSQNSQSNNPGKADGKDSDPKVAAQNESAPQGDKSQQPGDDQNANAQGQGQGQATEKMADAQSKSSDSSPRKGSDAQSGIGRQDGDKALKEAEQMKAIGKLEEIIGKRSANLTGEMSIETQSGNQQLKTAYTGKRGVHSDSGGEINRDQVPVAYQQYVREYMEQVRKQPRVSR